MKESGLWLPKSSQPQQTWLCLWRDEQGKYIVNEDYEFLCTETIKKGDKDVEEKMREAARSFGIDGGQAVWRKGRKITKTEWEVQMERMQDGKIPDEQEAYYANLEEEYVAERGIPREKSN